MKKTFKYLLEELNACEPAIEWAQDKTIKEVIRDAHRGADANAYATAYATAYAKNQKETAEICKKVLGKLIIKRVKELLI